MGRQVDVEGGVASPANPFADETALRYSNYCRLDGKRLVRADSGAAPSALTALVHDTLRSLVLSEHFSCVGAKSALRRGAYRFGLYPHLGSPSAAAGLARDLCSFVQHAPAVGGKYSTYLATFEGPVITGEQEFEKLLWDTLQQLHDLDVQHHGWDESVSSDAQDPRFSFSFAGLAFFIVGLHAASSRAARRFAWPTLAFNPHGQFVRLRAHGPYGGFQRVIRSAERALQGGTNPMLADFGERSEAAQYSGRHVDETWRCPFHTRHGRGKNGQQEP